MNSNSFNFSFRNAYLEEKISYRIIIQTKRDSNWKSFTYPHFFIKLFGKKGQSLIIPLITKWKSSKDDLLITSFNSIPCGYLNKIRLGLTQAPSSLFIQNVTILNLAVGDESLFRCNCYLNKSETDPTSFVQEFETSNFSLRNLSAVSNLVRRKKKFKEGALQQKFNYQVEITTAESKGSGTSGKVYITIFGTLSASESILLDNHPRNFETGRLDIFQLQLSNLGEITKIKLGQDGSGDSPNWLVDKILIKDLLTNKQFFFFPSDWFSSILDDKTLFKEIFPTAVPESYVKCCYWITIKTGQIIGDENKSDIIIQFFGTLRNSRKARIRAELTSFYSGKLDLFSIKDWDVGDITKISIQKVNENFVSWFIQDVSIKNLSTGKEWYFNCQCWFSRNHDKGQIQREIPSSPLPSNQKFYISVITGTALGSGTDSEVSLQLFGELGQSKLFVLSQPIGSKKPFQPGSIDNFQIESPNIGNLKKIKIGHNGKGFNSDWFLEKVIIMSDRQYFFHHRKWIHKSQNFVELSPFLNDENLDDENLNSHYKIIITTGSIQGAGTDANVFIQMFGDLQTSQRKILDKVGNQFETGNVDTFVITCTELGKLHKILIGHDGKGLGSSWFLDNVEIENVSKGERYFFPCKRWFSTSEDDGQLEREIPVSTNEGKNLEALVSYEIDIETGKIKGGGTDANVFIKLFGKKGDSGKRKLTKSKEKFGVKNINLFESGNIDTFEFQCVDLGDIQKILIGHDGTGIGSGWFLETVKVTISKTKQIVFPCHQWLDLNEGDRKIERELVPETSSKSTYSLTVITGSELLSDNISSISLILQGEKGKLDKQVLTGLNRNHKPFQRGAVDEFLIEGQDIGNFQTCTVSIDGKSWFLDKLLIKNNSTQENYVFPCGQWFGKTKQNNPMERTLSIGNPSQYTSFKVFVKTGSVIGAGTDANVYLVIKGAQATSPKIPLEYSLTSRNKFENGSLDVFTVAASNLGKLCSILIGHDGKGIGSGWFLESIEMEDLITYEHFYFKCNQWIDEGKGDKKLERELFPNPK